MIGFLPVVHRQSGESTRTREDARRVYRQVKREKRGDNAER